MGDITNELVRHFLIETSAKGVRLKGCPNEPYFGELLILINTTHIHFSVYITVQKCVCVLLHLTVLRVCVSPVYVCDYVCACVCVCPMCVIMCVLACVCVCPMCVIMCVLVCVSVFPLDRLSVCVGVPALHDTPGSPMQANDPDPR